MTTTARQNLKRLAAALALGGLAGIVAAFAYLHLTPRRYESTVRVKLEMRGVDQGEGNIRSAVASEFSSKAAECAYLNSDPFLNQVIGNLGLRAAWASTNAPLETNETLRVLRSKIRIEPVPGASLIRIRVTSADREDTAPLANGIARLYRDDHQSRDQALKLDKLRDFKKQWEEANGKVTAAEGALSQMAYAINLDRATNVVNLIDPGSLHDTQYRSIELESEYVREQNLSEQLKKMDRAQLRRVLPNVVTNALLDQLLAAESAAERDQTNVKLGHGPDGLDEKHATLLVNELYRQITEAVAGVMQARDARLIAMKSEIDSLHRTLAGATTSAETPAEPPAYAKAREELDGLRQERDALQEQITRLSLLAVLPLSLSVEIVDTADTPVRPVSPSRNVARGLGLGGCVAVMLGLFLRFVSGRTRKKAG